MQRIGIILQMAWNDERTEAMSFKLKFSSCSLVTERRPNLTTALR